MTVQRLVQTGKTQFYTVGARNEQFIGNDNMFVMVGGNDCLASFFFAFFCNYIACAIEFSLEIENYIGLLFEVEGNDILT